MSYFGLQNSHIYPRPIDNVENIPTQKINDKILNEIRTVVFGKSEKTIFKHFAECKKTSFVTYMYLPTTRI